MATGTCVKSNTHGEYKKGKNGVTEEEWKGKWHGQT